MTPSFLASLLLLAVAAERDGKHLLAAELRRQAGGA
jgi:hypothetical protein